MTGTITLAGDSAIGTRGGGTTNCNGIIQGAINLIVGDITGGAQLDGTGVFNAANTYSGTTTLNAGSPAAIALNGGTLTGTAYTGTVNVGRDAAMSGTFATVSTGTINTTGGMNVTTLIGHGNFSGRLVTVTGAHNPGDSPGTQTFDNLTYGDGATLNLEIDADGSSADSIVVGNSMTLANNVSLTISLFGATTFSSTFWDSDWRNQGEEHIVALPNRGESAVGLQSHHCCRIRSPQIRSLPTP